MTIAQKVAEAGIQTEYALPMFHNWRYLPSATIDVVKEEAKKFVYDCESFQEFHLKSSLPYAVALEMWETAWENYETEENRATGN